jgi:putative oxidoreductase
MTLLQSVARINVGLVFVGIGGPKFVPGMSPAAEVVMRTADEMSYGLVDGGTALVLTGVLECLVGLTLITGRWLGAGMVVLAAGVLGNLPPLVTGFLPGGTTPPTGYLLVNLALSAVGLALATRTVLGPAPRDIADRRVRTGAPV